MPETAHIAANAAAPHIAGAALCLLAPEETIGGATCPVCCTRDICNWIEFSDSGADRTCIAIESVISTSGAGLQTSEFEPQLESEDGNKNVSDLTGADQTVAAIETATNGVDPLGGPRSVAATYDGRDRARPSLMQLKPFNCRSNNYSYTPFGALLSSSGSSSPSNPFRFSSEYSDGALGLVYYNYRNYNPSIGRWASRDLIEETYGNRYVFSENTAINAFDFLGLSIPKVIEKFDIKYRENDSI